MSISDGMFTNNATAVITVEVINVRPSVLLDGNVSGCDVLNCYMVCEVGNCGCSCI